VKPELGWTGRPKGSAYTPSSKATANGDGARKHGDRVILLDTEAVPWRASIGDGGGDGLAVGSSSESAFRLPISATDLACCQCRSSKALQALPVEARSTGHLRCTCIEKQRQTHSKETRRDGHHACQVMNYLIKLFSVHVVVR
jgi:hypothetical protein